MIFSPARRIAPRRAACAVALVAILAAPAAWAQDQGTEEQQEACAPDAVKLCQNTIPDVPKTTACMKRNFAKLTPRCQAAFNEATGGSGKAPPREATREAPPAAARPDRDVETTEAAPERVPGLRAYQAQIRQNCRDGLIDAFTCRNTLDALKASE